MAACGRLVIFICQKPTTYNKSAMVMRGVFGRGGSREVTKPTTTAQLKMENACILRNVIETFL